MAWLPTNEIKNKFSIQSNKYDTQIEYASQSAALVLQRGVDAAIYAEAIGTAPTTPAETVLRYNSVVESHSYLTMWFLVGNVGNKLGDTGFIKAAQDSASPAAQRIVTNSYLTPEELEIMRENFLMQARFHLGDYGIITVVVSEPATDQQRLDMSSLQWF